MTELLPWGIPPVFSDMKAELESYLTDPEPLPIHDYRRAQKFWKRTPKIQNLYKVEKCPPPTKIQVNRNPTNGEILDFVEVSTCNAPSSGTSTGTTTKRPIPDVENQRKSKEHSMWVNQPNDADLSKEMTSKNVIDFENNLLSVPPGFSRGMVFEKLSLTPVKKRGRKKGKDDKSKNLSDSAEKCTSHLIDLMEAEDRVSCWSSLAPQVGPSKERTRVLSISMEGEDDVLPKESSILSPGDVFSSIDVPSQKAKCNHKNSKWAVMLDTREDMDYFEERIVRPAREWPFPLDTFQKQAIIHMEKHHNVFVAAHTSAGKTVVAEYAIAMSERHLTRAIYTSPVKALSNQKFRDFRQIFGNVGLLTGDTQINPEATCLIMTTEILRLMLYNGSDVIKDLEWVIFDEVHYINDPERGVVWEEVVIMLPQHVKILMLSATVPNVFDFADWVGSVKERKMYVVSTECRPVPLEHYLYTGIDENTKNQQFLLIDKHAQINRKGHDSAVRTLRNGKFEAPGSKNKKFGNKDTKNRWSNLVLYLQEEDKLPAVCFTFSRVKCDQHAFSLASMDLSSREEKNKIHVFLKKSVSLLKEEDQNIPQVIALTDLLLRGVGVHHSGILPILKELVELLFQEGLVKVLFATETFAMGLNMPARTVMFDDIGKHDGTQRRRLLPSEYVQMAGRAGRRGIDTIGTVFILCPSSVPTLGVLKDMILGHSKPLESKFRLTYAMVLNVLSVETLQVGDMMKQSFSEARNQKQKPLFQEKLQKLRNVAQAMKRKKGDFYEEINKYYKVARGLLALRNDIHGDMYSHPSWHKEYLLGRGLIIFTNKYFNSVAVLLNRFGKHLRVGVLANKNDLHRRNTEESAAADCLKLVRAGFKHLEVPAEPVVLNILNIEYRDILLFLPHIFNINADLLLREWENFLRMPNSQFYRYGNITNAVDQLRRCSDVYKNYMIQAIDEALDDDCRNMVLSQLKNGKLVDGLIRTRQLQRQLHSFTCTYQPAFLPENNYHSLKLEEDMDQLTYQLSDESLSLMPEYRCRLDVLKRMKYVDENETLMLKGAVARQMGTGCIFITEILMENILVDHSPAVIAALLSGLVYQKRGPAECKLSPELLQGMENMKKIAESIEKVQEECGVYADWDDYSDTLNFGLVGVVHEWAKGVSFAELMKLTDVAEGMIVRTIQRLDERMRAVKTAARTIGDPRLEQKIEEARQAIKRDIVFAASLYTQ